jgi:hypothetical protein
MAPGHSTRLTTSSSRSGSGTIRPPAREAASASERSVSALRSARSTSTDPPEPLDVALGASDLDRAGGHEPARAGRPPGGDAECREGDRLRSLQGDDPADGTREAAGSVPLHALGKREGGDPAAEEPRQHLGGRLPAIVDAGEEVLPFRRRDAAERFDGHPDALRESDRRAGRSARRVEGDADGWAGHLALPVLLAVRYPLDQDRKPPRRPQRADRSEPEAGIEQAGPRGP